MVETTSSLTSGTFVLLVRLFFVCGSGSAACWAPKGEQQMKVEYEFVTGTVEVEVPDEWGTVLIDLDRQEYNNDHKETRRHCSLEAYNQDNTLLPSDEDVMRDILVGEDKQCLREAIGRLEPRQQKLIRQVYFEGRTFTAIAQEEGVDRTAVSKATKRAVKKLRKFLG